MSECCSKQDSSSTFKMNFSSDSQRETSAEIGCDYSAGRESPPCPICPREETPEPTPLEICQEEKKCCQEKIAILQKEVSHYEKALERRDCLVNEMQKKLKSSCDATISEMKRMVCEMEKIRNENINLKEEIVKCNEKLARRDRCVKELQEAVKKHMETEDCLVRTNDKLKMENCQIRKDVREAQSHICALEIEVAAKKRLLESYECKRSMACDYERVVQELACYKNKFEDVKTTLKDVLRDKKDMESRLTDQYRELKKLKNAIPPENVLNEARHTIENQHKEITRLKCRDEEQRSRLSSLVNECQFLERKVGKLESQIINPGIVTDLENEVKDARALANRMENQKKCLEKQIAEEIKTRKLRDECVDKLRAELQRQVQECQDMMEKFQNEKNILSNNLCNLKEDLKCLQGVLSSKEKLLKNAECENKRLCCEQKETCAALNRAKKEIDILNQRIKCYENDIAQKCSVIMTQSKELQCVNEELCRKDAMIKKLNLINSSLKCQLTSCRDQLECKNDELAATCTEAKNLRQNVECLRKELYCKVEALEERIQMVKKDNECKQNKIFCLCMELEKVKQQAADCNTNLSSCNETIKCLRESMAKKDQLISELRAEKDCLDTRVAEMEVELRELESCRRRVCCLDAYTKNVEGKLKQLRCENESLERQDKSLEEQIATLQDRVIDLQGHTKNLEEALCGEKNKNRNLSLKSQYDKQRICELEAINKDLEHINDKIENRLEEEAFKCRCVPNIYTPC